MTGVPTNKVRLSVPLSLRLTDALAKSLHEVAGKMRLRPADVGRMAMSKGLAALLAELNPDRRSSRARVRR